MEKKRLGGGVVERVLQELVNIGGSGGGVILLILRGGRGGDGEGMGVGTCEENDWWVS